MRHKSDLLEELEEFSGKFGGTGGISGSEMSVPQEVMNYFEEVTKRINLLHSDQVNEYHHWVNILGEVSWKIFSTIHARAYCDCGALQSHDWGYRTLYVTSVKYDHLPMDLCCQTCCTYPKPYAILYNKDNSLLSSNWPAASSSPVRVFGCAVYVLKLPRGIKIQIVALEGVLIEVIGHD